MAHHHDHHHGTSDIGTAFFLNLVFAAIELAGGILTNSVFLLSDAIHDLGDSLSLGSAYVLEKVSGKKPDRTFTYGYGRFSVLGALITALVLIGGTVFILIESIGRLFSPEEVNAPIVILFAIGGLLVNGYAAWRTSKSSSINARVVSLHMLEDMLGWAVLLVVSIIMTVVHVPILDPIMSIIFSLVIVVHAFKHLKTAAVVFLEGSTGRVADESIRSELIKIGHVMDVHHIHQWTTDGNMLLSTMHVRLDCVIDKDSHAGVMRQIKDALEALGIHHSTVEVEYGPCADAHCHPVAEASGHHHH